MFLDFLKRIHTMWLESVKDFVALTPLFESDFRPPFRTPKTIAGWLPRGMEFPLGVPESLPESLPLENGSVKGVRVGGGWTGGSGRRTTDGVPSGQPSTVLANFGRSIQLVSPIANHLKRAASHGAKRGLHHTWSPGKQQRQNTTFRATQPLTTRLQSKEK